MPTIRLDKEADRWKWTCPYGHRTWEPTNGHFWCQSCAQASSHEAGDVDPVFYELRDDTTGKTYTRDKVELLTPVGPYEGRGSA